MLGADLNGHVAKGNIENKEVMGRYGAGTRNEEERMVVDFAKRIDLAVFNTFFKKKEKHRLTYKRGNRKKKLKWRNKAILFFNAVYQLT